MKHLYTGALILNRLVDGLAALEPIGATQSVFQANSNGS